MSYGGDFSASSAEFSGTDLRFSEVISFTRQGFPANFAAVRGTDDAPAGGMAFEIIDVRTAKTNGHTATFYCSLAGYRGWEVCAELDGQILKVRHCSDWRSVERAHLWLLTKLYDQERVAA